MAHAMDVSDNGTDHAGVIALGSDDSIAADQYDDYDSVSSVSTFTDLLRRYTFAFQPDYSLKLRKRYAAFALPALHPWAEPPLRVLEPFAPERRWKRAIVGVDLTVSPERSVSLVVRS